MKTEDFFDKIYTEIKLNRLGNAIELTLEGVQSTEFRNEIILIASRHRKIKFEKIQRLASEEEILTKEKQLEGDFLELLEVIQSEDEYRPPKFRIGWTTIKTGLIFLSLAGIILIIVILPNHFKYGDSNLNTVTVRVHENGAFDKTILPNRGKVELIYGESIIPKRINDEGEATFKDIPDRFFEDDARVRVIFRDPEKEPYHAVNPDSLYELKMGERIDLAIELKNLETLKGRVYNKLTGKPVSGVRVSANGMVSHSNDFGEFKIEFPIEKRKKYQTVHAQKEGYKYYQLKVPIQTQDEMTIPLEIEK